MPETAEVADTLSAADLPPETAEATAQVLAFWEQVRASATCRSKMSSPSSGQGSACRQVQTTNKARVDDLGLSRGAGDENRTRALSLGITGDLALNGPMTWEDPSGQPLIDVAPASVGDRCLPHPMARFWHVGLLPRRPSRIGHRSRAATPSMALHPGA
ncbi:hypothetical protein [Streptomyces sp. NRRL F-5681]|uniref:hypothetical protein n=1 Tax=Streptomyces sp. NRRL F-5681 TaxID=1463869 RepID=UPI002D219C70|nr:hypothetical protein [Streptomyces sp. NRRL F-5681]